MDHKWILIGGLLIAAVTVHAQCPPMCSCSANQVTCSSANYTSIPRLIAQSTTTLDLTGNLISHVTHAALTSLRNMVDLKLKRNVITSVDDGAFETMESLQVLDLSQNRLSSVTEQTFYGAAQTLMQLDISDNNLRHVDGAFSSMSVLSRLDLADNDITRLTLWTFRDLRELRYLSLARNQISHIDKRAFKNLDKLMYLILKANPLHNIPKFEFQSQYLSYMDLSECGLSDVGKALPGTIQYVQLRRNNITRLGARAFKHCPYINILVLDENGLTHIDDSTFTPLSSLQQLWLNGNKLTSVPRVLPVSLERLLMDQNHVTSIDQSIASADSQLRMLSLMGNAISHLYYDAFTHLRHLTSLDLSNNQIGHVYGNTFVNNRRLQLLLLSKNPLQYMHSHALWGLGGLERLSLDYIESDVAIHEDAFKDLKQLETLHMDSSPALIRTVLSSPALTNSLQSVKRLSLLNCELTRLDPSFTDTFANLSRLNISSSSWHCDAGVTWLRDWLVSTQMHVQSDIVCYSPRPLHGRSITSLRDSELSAITPTRYRSTTPGVMHVFSTFISSVSTSSEFMHVATTSPSPPNKVSQTPPHTELHDDEDYDDGSAGDVAIHDDVSPRGHIDFDLDEPFDDWYQPQERHADPFEPLFNGSLHENGRYNYDMPTLYPPFHPSPHNTHDPGGRGGPLSSPSSITIIITIVTIATIIIAAIIIALIIYFTRKQSNIKDKPPVYKNGIQYKHKNNVLYFMPNGLSCQGGGEPSESVSGSVRTNSSSGSKRHSERGKARDAKEEMTLIPGRDIKHEGPIRVYQWEDF